VYVGDGAQRPKKKSVAVERQTGALIYEVQVTLDHITPPIWRRFTVPAAITLEQFHAALLAVMGWSGGHLYEFRVRGETYGDPEALGDPDVTPAAVMTLAQAVHRRQGTFYYVYDWGDEWWHQIKLRDYRPQAPGETVPRILDGARACPPEDVGGVWGYGDFLEAVQNPTHPEHAAMLSWVGGSWDPEHFDRELLQRRLTAVAQRGGWG
jgi:hypothetical protein